MVFGIALVIASIVALSIYFSDSGDNVTVDTTIPELQMVLQGRQTFPDSAAFQWQESTKQFSEFNIAFDPEVGKAVSDFKLDTL